MPPAFKNTSCTTALKQSQLMPIVNWKKIRGEGSGSQKRWGGENSYGEPKLPKVVGPTMANEDPD